MLKAAQTKWISRLVAKTSIQDALIQFDQQLKDAAMSFQVRRQTALQILVSVKTERGRNQVSSLIEIHYAIGARSGGSSNDTPRITDGDTFTSPTKSFETLASAGSGPTLECSSSSIELVQQSRGSAESLLSSFTLVEADSMALGPGSELPPDATPVPTEEEEFLASMGGDADEFGVRLCCLYPRLSFGSRHPSSADITNPKLSFARQIAKPLVGLQERRRHIPEVKK